MIWAARASAEGFAFTFFGARRIQARAARAMMARSASRRSVRGRRFMRARVAEGIPAMIGEGYNLRRGHLLSSGFDQARNMAPARLGTHLRELLPSRLDSLLLLRDHQIGPSASIRRYKFHWNRCFCLGLDGDQDHLCEESCAQAAAPVRNPCRSRGSFSQLAKSTGFIPTAE